MDKTTKWPNVTLIRHDVSKYNAMKLTRAETTLYREFREAFEKTPTGNKTQQLANQVKEEFALNVGDHNTPLHEEASQLAVDTGRLMKKSGTRLPDVIFVSPYERTLGTLASLTRGWPELGDIKTYEEERIREQEHGLALLFNDWRVFHVLHPEQGELYRAQGRYWYRYPNGENVPDVRLRNRQWLTTLTREFSGSHVLAVTHHLTILATRANLERLSADDFIELDEKSKPRNCGVTHYRSVPTERGGKLELDFYNRVYME